MTGITELEKALLDQIEKLNDDSIAEDMDKAQVLIQKSQAMGELAGKYVDIQTLKLNIVKVAESCRGDYDNYLGIEAK